MLLIPSIFLFLLTFQTLKSTSTESDTLLLNNLGGRSSSITSSISLEAINSGDKAALCKLYSHNNGAAWNWGLNVKWDCVTPGEDLCASKYAATISCDVNGRVTQLTLNNFGIKRSLPAELGNLQFLTGLYMRSNSLNGTIPTQFGLLTNIVTLNLETNLLSGSIPSQIGAMNKLQILYLDQNSLTGTIPTQMGLLTSLTQLYLEMNSLSGPIPSQLAHLVNIQQLYLNNNLLAGPIPVQLGALSGALHVNVYSNKDLCGAVPISLCPIGSLSVLETGLYCPSRCKSVCTGANVPFNCTIPTVIVQPTNTEVISIQLVAVLGFVALIIILIGFLSWNFPTCVFYEEKFLDGGEKTTQSVFAFKFSNLYKKKKNFKKKRKTEEVNIENDAEKGSASATATATATTAGNGNTTTGGATAIATAIATATSVVNTAALEDNGNIITPVSKLHQIGSATTIDTVNHNNNNGDNDIDDEEEEEVIKAKRTWSEYLLAKAIYIDAGVYFIRSQIYYVCAKVYQMFAFIYYLLFPRASADPTNLGDGSNNNASSDVENSSSGGVNNTTTTPAADATGATSSSNNGLLSKCLLVASSNFDTNISTISTICYQSYLYMASFICARRGPSSHEQHERNSANNGDNNGDDGGNNWGKEIDEEEITCVFCVTITTHTIQAIKYTYTTVTQGIAYAITSTYNACKYAANYAMNWIQSKYRTTNSVDNDNDDDVEEEEDKGVCTILTLSLIFTAAFIIRVLKYTARKINNNIFRFYLMCKYCVVKRKKQSEQSEGAAEGGGDTTQPTTAAGSGSGSVSGNAAMNDVKSEASLVQAVHTTPITTPSNRDGDTTVTAAVAGVGSVQHSTKTPATAAAAAAAVIDHSDDDLIGESFTADMEVLAKIIDDTVGYLATKIYHIYKYFYNKWNFYFGEVEEEENMEPLPEQEADDYYKAFPAEKLRGYGASAGGNGVAGTSGTAPMEGADTSSTTMVGSGNGLFQWLQPNRESMQTATTATRWRKRTPPPTVLVPSSNSQFSAVTVPSAPKVSEISFHDDTVTEHPMV